MKEEEIAALARELAYELYNNDSSYRKILWWCEEPKERKAEELEYTLRFLLRRFCLVEKEAVRKQFESAKRLIEARDYNKQCIGVGSRCVLERLFPEIAKEVEE